VSFQSLIVEDRLIVDEAAGGKTLSDLSHRIETVLSERRRQLPVVDREIQRWRLLQDLLGELDAAARAARAADPDSVAAAGIADLDVPAMAQVVAESLATLAAVRARVSRTTINIGVSGRARNGKSTLLQSLSGLTDEQIPAGRGQPVTAVRSRILHSVDRLGAQLSMHSEQSFCEQVLGRYYTVLGLADPPGSIAEFVRHPKLSGDHQLAERMDQHPKLGPMLARLREMQDSVESYRHLLTGDVRDVKLAELRQWVAYPEGGESASADRRYLAVREAVIVCRFPLDDVIALGLVDLPGLGELVPQAEEHHLGGLQNDVDFVLVVKRPTDTNGLWAAEDGQSMELIGRARGAARLKDFSAILVNTGGCDEANVASLRSDIRQRLNEGVADRYYQVIEADAADRTAVRDDVLQVVLRHLAEALPRMDEESIRHAVDVCAAGRRGLLATAEQMLSVLRHAMTPTPVEQLIARADELRAEVAGSMQDWVYQLRLRATDSYEDDEFLARAAEVQQSVREWVLDGFGEGVDAWSSRALAQVRVDRAVAPFATHALNEVRVEIARRFGAIDDLLEQRRLDFWTGLTNALGPRFAPLLDAAEAAEPTSVGPRLAGLARRLREAPEPCVVLAESIEFVLDVRLDYRTRVLPRLRRSLDVLRPEPEGPRAEEMASLLSVPHTSAGTAELYIRLSHLARQAVHEAGTLLADEPASTAQVLYAFAEQFEDSFIRSRSSRSEFLRLAEAFHDQLWPAEQSGPALATAQIQRVRSLVTSLRHELSEHPSRAAEGQSR
jgi:hypothetical protein